MVAFLLLFVGMSMFTFTIRHIVQYLPFGVLLTAFGIEKYQGNYKNGTKDGYWEYFSPSGYLYEDYSGYFKNNKKVSSKI